MARRHLTVFILLFVITGVGSQLQGLGIGCPLQWESYQQNCYQFVFDHTKNYQEAATACWVQGSALVSVNTLLEHNFITQFLDSHGQHGLYRWYTSGEYIAGVVKWYGDGSYSNDTMNNNYWNSAVLTTFTEDRIAYTYSVEFQKYGFSKVSEADRLHYICEIPKAEISRLIHTIRDFDFGNQSSDTNKVLRGPHFIKEQENIVVVGRQYPVTIECIADGTPQPTFKWFEQNLDYSASYQSANYKEVRQVANQRYTFTNGRITINSPTENEDAGVYYCKASNTFGSIMSAPVMISFGYLSQFSPNQQGFVEAKLNQGTFINCNSPSAKPAVSYQWYKDHANRVINFVRPELNTYLFISGNGNLYLSEVQYSDGGNYFCIVTLVSRMGEKLSTPQAPSKTSKAIELRVKGSPPLDYGPIIHSDFIAVFPKPPMVGHDVRMECFAFGKMPMRYSWSRENKPFPDGVRFELDNRVLIIPNAQFDDGGNYTCKVEKTTGLQAVASKWFILELEAKPYFLHPLSNMHADIGGELTWRCEAMALPRATYAWYKNSQLVQGVAGEREVRGNVLVIHNLDKDRDEGMYQCSATNNHGTSISSAQLRVLSLEPSFAKYPLPTQVTAADGGNITIECVPEAAPQPGITWLHNGQDMGYGDNRVQILLDGTLHMTQVVQSDQGIYTCKATNINGEAQSSTRVLVVRGLNLQRKPSPITGAVNKTAFLYCHASYDSRVYDLIYTWKFNGHLINTRNDYFYRLGQQQNIDGLYIVNAQYRHTGTYECIAQTVMSSISAKAFLQITGPPGEPAGVYVETNSMKNNSVRLVWTWNPFSNHGFPVNFFDVEASTEITQTWTILSSDIPSHMTILSDKPMRRFVDIHNLLPYNSYRFRVRAKNAQGVGPSSKPSDWYRISAAAPTKYPTDIHGGGGSVQTLSIKWQAVDRSEEGGTGFGYKVFWRLGNQTNSHWHEKKVGNKTFHSAMVDKDNFYMIYEVTVQTYNDKGFGPTSPPAYIYSAEGLPISRPRNVKYIPLNGTAALITWDQVPNDRMTLKGKVLGYEIDYKDMNNKTHGQLNSVNVHCVCGEGLIVGLDPNSDYMVNVEVFNTAGKGTPSEKYKVSTYEEAPGQYPQFVDIFPHGSHSALVKWRGISITKKEATLSGYKILYWPVGDDIRTANSTFVEKETSGVIHELQWDTVYKLRVMGINRGGDGKKSPTVYFTVLKDGAININSNSFDPATSQMLFASSSSKSFLSLTVVTLCQMMFSYQYHVL